MSPETATTPTRDRMPSCNEKFVKLTETDIFLKERTMNRRKFLRDSSGAIAGLAVASQVAFGQSAGQRPILWHQNTASKLFVQVSADMRPLVVGDNLGLLTAFCTLSHDGSGRQVLLGSPTPAGQLGSIRAELTHRLHRSGGGDGEDLLEARLRLLNTSARDQEVRTGFLSHAQPGKDRGNQKAYLPLAASGLMKHPALFSLGYQQEQDPEQMIGRHSFVGHYLEPLASDPALRHSPAMLLVPAITLYHSDLPWRVSLFTPSGLAQRFATQHEPSGACGWSVSRYQTIPPGGEVVERCFLLVHRGEADVAWRAFHRFAHAEDFPAIGWLKDMRVHYYDFLSAAAPNGRRGDGYEADARWFRRFHVGMATQHGYYPVFGDYLDANRKTWKAMPTDKRGPAEMSLEKMRARIALTRAAGAKAAIYLHLTGLDDSSPRFAKLRDAVLVECDGKPHKVVWNGPDTIGTSWHMSLAAAEWRGYLLDQARLVMELLEPDAIVVDETFSGLGYDEHPDRRGCVSPHCIRFFRDPRALVRSHGNDRAVLTSDCSLASFVLWADGEAGDHAYPPLLGHPLYRKMPVRYLAALGDKPWRPCAWLFQKFWDAQMDLARKIGAGVGVSNGWLEYTGLARLSADIAKKMQTDIAALFETDNVRGHPS